jgi:hypothetical protein
MFEDWQAHQEPQRRPEAALSRPGNRPVGGQKTQLRKRRIS